MMHPFKLRTISFEEYKIDVLPYGWKRMIISGINEEYYTHSSGISALPSVNKMDDNSRWYCIYCYKLDKMPTWEEMYEIKRIFVGDDREALMVFPLHEDYVSSRFGIHIWASAD